MDQHPITAKRRAKIFFIGLGPIITLLIILTMAAQFGFNVLSFLTAIEERDAKNYVVVTRVFGLPISQRPANQADLNQDDALVRTVNTVVLIVSILILLGSLLMCCAAITGKPHKILRWCDRQLGSFRPAFPSLG